MRQSLLANLLIMTVVLSAALVVAATYANRMAVKTLSAVVLRQTSQHVRSELNRFFGPVAAHLRMVASWGAGGLLNVTDREGLNRLFAPVLAQYPQITSALLADVQGHEYLLLHDGHDWLNRETRCGEWGGRSRLWHWSDRQPDPVVSWQKLGYDPRERPWYRQALQSLHADSKHVKAVSKAVYYSEPYNFFTTGEPGITASMAFCGKDGQVRIAAFDVRLKDISAFTTGLAVSRHGTALILSDTHLRVIGLPRSRHFSRATDYRRALLQTPGQLKLPVLSAALRVYREEFREESEKIFRFSSGGALWWAGVSAYPIDTSRAAYIVVMVPQADLMGSLKYMRLYILAIIFIVLLLAVLRVFVLTGRYSRPVEALVQDSRRISRGDLEPAERIASPVWEFQRLAEAHDEMRSGLRVLMKLERDVQLARRIQQDTFPRRLPALSGYEITAWSQPAEGAGGDTFDVIGLSRTGDGRYGLSEDRADAAVFLLADAAGHGIGPALAVTQVRAMLRMAVRSGQMLPVIITQMNAQLCEDLQEGRFITAWFGRLDTASHRLTSFSAGQAPLFHYRAVDSRCRTLVAQVPPFGITEDIAVELPDPVILEPGDLFVVFSDGLIEPTDAGGRIFGSRRVAQVITACHAMPTHDLLATLREELGRYTKGAPAEDDQTAVIIKRLR